MARKRLDNITEPDAREKIDSEIARRRGLSCQRLPNPLDRFSKDFVFRLTPEETVDCLRSQFATSSSGHGGRRYLPYVFTVQGVAMLSSVLNSERAIQVNILIMRAFVRLRQMISTHKDLLRKVEEMEKKYDEQFQVVFEAIGQLMTPPEKPKRRNKGFRHDLMEAFPELDPAAISNILQELKRQGKIKFSGPSKTGYWGLTN